MTGMELAYLIGALGAVGLFLLYVRRASARSQLRGDDAQRLPADTGREDRPSADDSLAAGGVDDAAEVEEEEEEEEDVDEEVDADDDAGDEAQEDDQDEAERLRQGLAKTRSTGFVGRIGKLFSKKRIDASVLDELEEVLFTADIGPKTAQKLFCLDQGRSESLPAGGRRCHLGQAALRVGQDPDPGRAAGGSDGGQAVCPFGSRCQWRRQDHHHRQAGRQIPGPGPQGLVGGR